MLQTTVGRLALAGYLPWRRARIYQLVKKQPDSLKKYGCRVVKIGNRTLIEIDNKELEERIRTLTKPLQKYEKKLHKITVSLNPPKFILFNNLKPAFGLFLDSVSENDSLPLKNQKIHVYLSDKHFDIVKRLSVKYHIPMTKTLEGLIEMFLLNLSSKVNFRGTV